MEIVVLLILGLVGLWLGASLVVDTAKKIAVIMNISQTFIGLTVISIGTSLPEIMTNVNAGLAGASGIAVGTNIGSCFTQITFILGFSALFGTMYITKKLLKIDGFMILFSILTMFLIGVTGFNISWIEGAIIVTIYISYLILISRHESALEKITTKLNPKDGEDDHRSKLFKYACVMGIGIIILIYASELVVDNAIKLSDMWGVTQSFIGVLIIGVGTGLPELSTAITGIFKKAENISIGTLIGSNITDPLFSLGFGAIAAGSAGLAFSKNLLMFDLPFWFFATIVAILLFRRNMKIGKDDKKEGFILIGLYLLFVLIKLKFFMS